MQSDSWYNDCITDVPLYSKDFRAKVKKVSEGGNSGFPGLVFSRGLTFLVYSVRGLRKSRR